MSTTIIKSPTSRLRFGLARVEITPPPNIYHRLWGAARHDRPNGILLDRQTGLLHSGVEPCKMSTAVGY